MPSIQDVSVVGLHPTAATVSSTCGRARELEGEGAREHMDERVPEHSSERAREHPNERVRKDAHENGPSFCADLPAHRVD
ncbi:hypothetical protein ACFL6M_03965 [Candidatus Eisenbacteria bacterium]|uniref:Uncharacterized protein n=1 Tax=Eiseniibacteriota bacterium TaxID=2212470 RepID=A0ABV6YK77_UNCEI